MRSLLAQPRVALVTCDRFSELFAEEREIVPRLAARGVLATAVRWSDPSIDWRAFDRLILRSIWDYFERIDEFRRWLDRLEVLGAPLRNPLPLVRWNMDKRYLAELEERGVSIVPTRFLRRGTPVDLAAALAERGWGAAIVKPAISGNAHRTHRVAASGAAGAQRELEAILRDGDALVQPFVDEILREGEWSIFFFGGRFSHAVIKRPADGDFRVQEQHGGTFTRVAPSPSLIEEARRVIDLLPLAPLYARIDGVRRGGRFELMEVEAIEPYLYTAGDPDSLERFVDCVADDARK